MAFFIKKYFYVKNKTGKVYKVLENGLRIYIKCDIT